MNLTDNPTCPWCQFEITSGQPYWDIDKGSGASTDVTCPKCQKRFVVDAEVMFQSRKRADHSGGVTDMVPAVEPVGYFNKYNNAWMGSHATKEEAEFNANTSAKETAVPLYRHPSPMAGAVVGSRPPRLEEAYAEALVDMTWCVLSDMFKNSMESNGDSRDIVNTIIDCAQEFEIRFQGQVANGEIDPTDYLLEIEKESSLVYKSLINNEFIKKG